MLFDRVTGHSGIAMPCPKRKRHVCTAQGLKTNQDLKQHNQEQQTSNDQQNQTSSEIMLPLCNCGSILPQAHERNVSAWFSTARRNNHCVSEKGRGDEEDQEKVYFDEMHSIEQTHWICASCMAREFLKTPSPLCATYNYSSDRMFGRNSGNSSQTTATATAEEEKSEVEEEDEHAYKTYVDLSSARAPSMPSVSAHSSGDRCPECGAEISSLAVSMFLAICEAQYSDYTRMRECWINECVRNVRLRKLIRDLQHYLLFDDVLHGSRLVLEKTPQAYCVRVERRVDVPQHQRNNDAPSVEQRNTEVRTSIRARGSIETQLHDLPPLLVCRGGRRKRNKTLKSDHDWTEPRERLLFEALNLQNDFDEATMPINGNALTSREQRALRRAVRQL